MITSGKLARWESRKELCAFETVTPISIAQVVPAIRIIRKSYIHLLSS